MVERNVEEKADDRKSSQDTQCVCVAAIGQDPPENVLHHLWNCSSELWKTYSECSKENGKNRVSQVKAGTEGWGSICSFIYSNVQSTLSARLQ